MANYYQTTFFAPKDTLPVTDPNKTIFGAAYDVEFGNIATAISTKFDATTISTNAVLFNIGTAALPGIAFATKPSTGLSADSAGDLVISAGGVAQGTFYSSGGLAMPGATGGAQGIGTINTTGLYINGIVQNPSGFAPLASPAFTGTPTAPTAAVNNNSTQLATTAYVQTQAAAQIAAAAGAPLASPAFTGIPTAPTAATNTNTTQLATTAFVNAQIASDSASSPVLGGTPTAPTAAANTNTTQVATTANVVATIASQLGTLSGSTASGSFKFGPWLVNFGRVASASFPNAVTFHTAYSTAVYTIAPTGITTSDGTVPIMGTSDPSSSLTGFTCYSSITSGQSYTWFAIGQ